MIQSFADKETEKVFNEEHSRKLPTEIQQRAHNRLLRLASATSLDDLRLPSSNRLHLLGGDLRGRWSISINEQWRITFRWEGSGPAEVKIEDYH